jgi:hypothetical protein
MPYFSIIFQQNPLFESRDFQFIHCGTGYVFPSFVKCKDSKDITAGYFFDGGHLRLRRKNTIKSPTAVMTAAPKSNANSLKDDDFEKLFSSKEAITSLSRGFQPYHPQEQPHR